MVEVAFFSAWLTPTSLFILLNIVIATILFVSSTTTNNPSRGGRSQPAPSPLPPQPQPHLGRPPSFLSRVMSFNFSQAHYMPEPEPEPEPQHILSRSAYSEPARPVAVARSPSFFSRVMSFNSSYHPQVGPEPEPEHEPKDLARPVEVARAPSLLSRVASFSLQGLNRGVQPPQEAEKEESEPRESRGVEKKKMKKKKQQPVVPPHGGEGGGGGKETPSLSREEEVDSKADDFINKFKQQLKMQRLESLLRYRNSA